MDGEDADQEMKNVVRLPRDWVGPLEELVPMGRGEHDDRGPVALDSARLAGHGHASVPAADDFWGAGASAVHHAIRAPARAGDGRGPRTGTRARLRPPSRRAWGFRSRDASSPPAMRSARFGLGRGPVICAAVLVCVLVVAAVGFSERGSPSVGARSVAARSSSSGSAPRLLGEGLARPATTTVGGREDVSGRAGARHPARRTTPTSGGRHSGQRSAGGSHHRVIRRPTGSASSARTSSSASTNPTPTTPTPSEPTTSEPTATSEGAATSDPTASSHHAAYGQGGILGAGHSSGSS